MDMILHEIGILRSELTPEKRSPRQPFFSEHCGRIDIKDEYSDGLRDLDGFSHITILGYLHLQKSFSLSVLPPGEKQKKGLFATRSPSRPNPIGISTLALEKIEGSSVFVKGVDMYDQTPILDIKPYVPKILPEECRIGWLEERL